ncbi:hypothetical protein MIND_00503100 [Mycena indigotica]|uniref:Uncharacterized protein n=1 Tax=Mycena indigotica TaxID=2126181 RepID=A0A8H6W9X9_9AGAR|nr:uncharacterized protein MIND_00503100 [Mycena indigotica]KAF7307098.1 hypothetical protein MIND_00503100 [Mycena indigotica]
MALSLPTTTQRPPFQPQPDDEPELTSICESGVVSASLLQSRDNWLNSIFELYTGRTRPNCPPPTSSPCGVCTIDIGPHIFCDTSFYEVHYPPSQLEGSASTSARPSWSASIPMPNSDIVHAVNAAASSNPTFANLLHIAASGQATPDQLQTLGLLIQSLPPPRPPPLAPTTALAYDIVFQYAETPSQQCILPRVPAVWEKTGSRGDFALTLAIKPPNSAVPDLQIVTINFRQPHPTLSEAISRWVGNARENPQIIKRVKEQSRRVYLTHRVPRDQIVAQLKMSSVPNYSMTSIKPQPVVEPPLNPPQRKPRKPRTTTETENNTATPSQLEAPVKRKRGRPRKTDIVKLSCTTCQATDVPLVLGGRFCRPCVEAGKAVDREAVQHVFSVDPSRATQES